MMQHTSAATKFATWFLVLALPALACSSAPRAMSYSQEPSAEPGQNRIQFFTHDPSLYAAASRSLQRIESAVGSSQLALLEPAAAARCAPSQAGCGFELSFAPLVYCVGDPDPALACTSFAGGGKTLGIEMQSDLEGDELDNRLIHEFFHVITLDHAPHSADGLFMAYSLGDERITPSTLESVCGHFPCQQFVVEEVPSLPALVQR